MNCTRTLIPLLFLFTLTPTILPAQEDADWPRAITLDGGTVTLYQPQIESLTLNDLEARAAVSWQAKGDSQRVFGAVWLEAQLSTDRDERTATVHDIRVTAVRFPDASEENEARLVEILETEIPKWELVISLDEVLTDLDPPANADTEGLNNDAPRIVVSKEPAVLVSFDGEPRFEAVSKESKHLERVVNTPFLVVQDRKKGRWYLSGGGDLWYVASDVLGPWQPTGKVPKAISSLLEEEEGETASAKAKEGPPPKILVSTEPAELVVIDGEPTWAPVAGTGELLYLENTDSDVFLEIPSQSYFVLLSGRWYRAPAVEGDLDWEWVANDGLPVAFSDIPEDSVNAEVLPHVAGTVQAREAVLDNTIPQTAAIRRDDSSAKATYSGDPAFETVSGAEGGLEYAVNTSQSVFKLGSRYFLCEQGVWYEAASATGPWAVSTSVPPEIYSLPPSNPHYNVTYVKVYDVTPQVVYVGYTPGYTHSYISHGCVVYGTGWHYNPWYGPYYYPRPWSWGVHVRYNPWYGWGFGISFSNGPFTFSFGSWSGGYYRPYPGWGYPGYRPPAWWGPGGYRPYPRPTPYAGYHKRPIATPMPAAGVAGRPSARPAPGMATRPAPAAQPNLYNRPGNQDRMAPRPQPAIATRPTPAQLPNDVLTDRSGNVYRRDPAGDWQQREGGQWRPANGLDRPGGGTLPSTRPSPGSPSTLPSTPSTRPPTPSTRPLTPTTRPAPRPSTPSARPTMPSTRPAPRPQLERDWQSRQRGSARSRSYGSMRPSPSARPSPGPRRMR